MEGLEGGLWLVGSLVECHAAGVGISQAVEAVTEGCEVVVLDGFSELLEFAEGGAIGGESLEVIGRLIFVSRGLWGGVNGCGSFAG